MDRIDAITGSEQHIMTIVRRAGRGSWANTNSRDIAPPTGTAEDDLVILCAGGVDRAPDDAVTGFTLLGKVDTGSYRFAAWWKIATASEPANYTVTFPTINYMVVVANSFYSDAAINLSAGNWAMQSGSASTSQTYPSVVANASTDALFCAGVFSAAADPVTPDAAMTELQETASTSIMAYTQWQLLSSAGATGTRTSTGDTSTTASVFSLIIREGAVDLVSYTSLSTSIGIRI